MFRDGRYSLLIGLCFLTMAIFISDYIGSLISNESSAWLIQESVVIGGWVALWHPLNIFLYDWWPLRAQADTGSIIQPQPAATRLAARHLQPLLAPDPLDTLVVDVQPFAPKHSGNLSIAVAAILQRQLHDPPGQLLLIDAAARPVALRRASLPQQSADPAL